MNYYIFKGRFQPFHYGHLQVVEKTLEMLSSDDIFIIATMCSFDVEIEPIDKHFAEMAAEHRQPERNPWGSVKALEAITEVSKYFIGRNNTSILATFLPYPNLAWPIIKNWFPPNRIWIIHDAGEEFDDAKAQFYSNQGEKVIRIKDDSEISGRELRTYYYSHDRRNFCKGVPDFLHDIYWNNEI